MNTIIATLKDHEIIVAAFGAALFLTLAWCAVVLPSGSMRAVSAVVLAVWAIAVAAIVLKPLPTADGFDGVANLVPGRTIMAGLTGSSVDGLQLVGNLLLLTPFGALARFVFPLTRLGVVALGAVIAVAIELTQWVLATGRSSDIDDVIMNALGVALALFLMETATRRLRPRQVTQVTKA